jgi:hypothetical protein
MSGTIRAKHYGETEKAFSEDPIVIQMANELPDQMVKDFCHDDGSPNMDLMLLSNKEYESRGGVPKGHIGAIAHAILMIKGFE